MSVRSTLSFPRHAHKSVLNVCVSSTALQIGPSVPFFLIKTSFVLSILFHPLHWFSLWGSPLWGEWELLHGPIWLGKVCLDAWVTTAFPISLVSTASSTLTLLGKLNQHLMLSHAELFVPYVYYAVSRFVIFLEFSVVKSPWNVLSISIALQIRKLRSWALKLLAQGHTAANDLYWAPTYVLLFLLQILITKYYYLFLQLRKMRHQNVKCFPQGHKKS